MTQETSFMTRRPVAILMVFLAAVVFGYFSYGRLAITLMPELTYPTVTVRTEYPGAAPEEVENDISRPLEDNLGVIGGLRRISSISRAGISDVVLEFSWDTDMSDAVQDTLEKLDLVELPEEADRPLILRFDPSLDPVLELSLTSRRKYDDPDAELRRVRRIAELQVKKALEPIKGVAAVRVRGGLEEEIHVRVDEEALRRSGLSIGAVISRLNQENVNVAGGTLKEGRSEFMVRTLGEFQRIQEIADTVLALVDGREVRVGDVALVELSHRDRQMSTRTNGGESVMIDVFKEADANIVDLARRVKAAIGEAPPAMDEAGESVAPVEAEGAGRGRRRGPAGIATVLAKGEQVELAVAADQSIFIKSSIDEVKNTAILGGLLAVLVLFLFLKNVRSTLIIAVSIPISLMVTFAPLNLLGVSLNIMSLGGLALGIGMLVDSSIVVLESIYRCREEGDPLEPATIRGTREVRAAVVASILTSVAVFLPMVFVEGIAGQAFGDLGLAVVVSLLVSMIVALFFIPMLASRRGLEAVAGGSAAVAAPRWLAWADFRRDFAAGPRLLKVVLSPYLALRLVLGTMLELLAFLVVGLVTLVVRIGRTWVVPAIAWLFSRIAWLPLRLTDASLASLSRLYPGLLRAALRHQIVVFGSVLACFGLIWWTVATMDTELLPEVHRGEFTFEMTLPVGTPLPETERVLAPVEEALLKEVDDIEALIVTTGYDPTTTQRSDEGEHTARFKVLLKPTRNPARMEARVIRRIRDRLADIPDLDARVVRPVLFSFRTPIEVEVHGNDLARLKEVSLQVEQRLARLPELADVESTLKSGAPEVQIVYDRNRLIRYGINVAEVAELVRHQVRGTTATRFNEHDRRIPIVVRLDETDRETVEDVRELVVNPGAERPIPVSAIADVTLGEGPSEVRRIDGHRVGLVRANIAEGSLGGSVVAIERSLSAMDWPTDMTYVISGQNEEWERSRGSLWLALGLSIFLVYVIMAAQFESLLHPLVIMFTIPLAFVGALLTLKSMGVSLSVVVFLGMIMLAGIVVNNAIVLVDYVNTLRGRGEGLRDAVVTAGQVRLRPILMTTATTVLGLLPMALGWGDGAEIRTPMALTVITGLIASTVLTLVVIPVVYTAIEESKGRLLPHPAPLPPVEVSR